jgi:hypothetical protein
MALPVFVDTGATLIGKSNVDAFLKPNRRQAACKGDLRPGSEACVTSSSHKDETLFRVPFTKINDDRRCGMGGRRVSLRNEANSPCLWVVV